jgi:broad specificity phosphatase PhoE
VLDPVDSWVGLLPVHRDDDRRFPDIATHHAALASPFGDPRVRIGPGMRQLELRRHAIRQKDEDALSPEGRIQAESVGRTLPADYAFVFISPTKRTAETVAWFLRATRQPLPPHAVVPELASEAEDRWRRAASAARSSRIDAIMTVDADLVATESQRLARSVAEMMGRVPDGGRALAVGHSPLIGSRVRPTGHDHRAPR